MMQPAKRCPDCGVVIVFSVYAPRRADCERCGVLYEIGSVEKGQFIPAKPLPAVLSPTPLRPAYVVPVRHNPARHNPELDLTDRPPIEPITDNYLSNLLAVIHGDGGHYEQDHGTEKAVNDALAKWYKVKGAAEAADPSLDVEIGF